MMKKRAEELRKRIEVNDAVAMYVLGGYYNNGKYGLLQDQEKAMELWKQAAKLGSSMAHYELGFFEEEGGYLKKAKFLWRLRLLLDTKLQDTTLD